MKIYKISVSGMNIGCGYNDDFQWSKIFGNYKDALVYKVKQEQKLERDSQIMWSHVNLYVLTQSIENSSEFVHRSDK